MTRRDSMTTESVTGSIYDGLVARAVKHPQLPAILAPGRCPLTFELLRSQIEASVRALKSAGIRRKDRVALVLPNGPEMVTAFLAVGSCATSAPLNPAYRAVEFDAYLRGLNVAALIVQKGIDSPAREVAMAQCIPVFELLPESQKEAGIFHLIGYDSSSKAFEDVPLSDDVALILQTSGTTSRPKLVPLTHRNLLVSARNNRTSLKLCEDDRYLNIMPLFHIHSLLLILGSLLSGGSVIAAPAYEPDRFFRWLDELRPTWYSAAPTLHQAILAEASGHQAVIARRPLRLIRSSAAPLPTQVMEELERVFQTPVVEAYGMTETPFPVTSNPLPPGKRKPGSVGIAAGPEVAIMDEEGHLAPTGVAGEVIIRGGNVMRGYEDNPTANGVAFRNGWFRSGDQGYFDSEGYLYITGRIKEIINRGGEKISPREIEEALLDHPAVAQAVAFGVAHVSLGEDILAAVSLRKTSLTTESELRHFMGDRLADFKVPRQILILDELPKGPSGKLQRSLLAEQFGVGGRSSPRQTEQPTQENDGALKQDIAKIWAGVLGLDRVAAQDNFFELGGDSIKVTQVVSQLRHRVDTEIPLRLLFEYPTLAEFAEQILNRFFGSQTTRPEPRLV